MAIYTKKTKKMLNKFLKKNKVICVMKFPRRYNKKKAEPFGTTFFLKM